MYTNFCHRYVCLERLMYMYIKELPYIGIVYVYFDQEGKGQNLGLATTMVTTCLGG